MEKKKKNTKAQHIILCTASTEKVKERRGINHHPTPAESKVAA